MKKLILIPLIFLSAWSLVPAQDTLLLFHPTAYNIEMLLQLSRAGHLDLENYHILGVYHSGESYDYAISTQWLDQHPESPVSLKALEGHLVQDSLFLRNACSEDFQSLFNSSKGALFLGGPDIPPAIYGEATHLLTSVTDPYRHYMELSFIFHLLGGAQDESWEAWMDKDPDYLLSGICLGMQTMNVATGGTMIQDIPTEIYGIWTAEEILALPPAQRHRNYQDMVQHTCTGLSSYHFHRIDIQKKSFLAKRVKSGAGRSPMVLSSHHQALEELGKGWKVAALSMDGKIVEAIGHDSYPNVFGVQFHPEKPGLFDPNIKQMEACGQESNFQEVAREGDSFDFHLAYWNYVGKILSTRSR